jgi:hypothetical protein
VRAPTASGSAGTLPNSPTPCTSSWAWTRSKQPDGVACDFGWHALSLRRACGAPQARPSQTQGVPP